MTTSDATYDEYEKWVSRALSESLEAAERRKRIIATTTTAANIWALPRSSSRISDHMHMTVDNQIQKHIREKMTGVDSKHKHPAKGEDGSWSCTECGAESFDKDQFEEAAGYMDCPGPDLTDYVKSEKLASQITSVREAMKQMGTAAEKTKDEMENFSREILRQMKLKKPTDAGAGVFYVPEKLTLPMSLTEKEFDEWMK